MEKLNTIAFINLRAEMMKKQVTVKELSDSLNIRTDILHSKLAGRGDINLDEALCIARVFFPEHSVYYLFEELVDQGPPKQSA